MIHRLVAICVAILLNGLASAQDKKTEILILGSDHLAQIYKKDFPNTDVLQPKGQQDIEAFASLIKSYNPDMIMVEELPERQSMLDSLYVLYRQNKPVAADQSETRSEIFQLAFRIGRQLKLDRIYGVNAPGGTSQGILTNGTNIELYKAATADLRTMVSEKYAALQNGRLALKDYLIFLNQPETYNKIYHLRYVIPSRVTNGTFTKPDAMVDTAFINPAYIGAELTSIFKNRDYKIYSNIVTRQLIEKPKRILLIIGVAHIGSLKSIFRDDPGFIVIDANKYLKKVI